MFRAYNPDGDRLVALKLFRLDLPPERAQRFADELERLSAAKLAGKGIVAPLAAGIQDNCPFVAQEFMAAESLDVVVRERGASAPSEAVRIAAELAAGLDAAAAADIRHGTIHPRDVMVASDEARVTGLGVAQALEKVGVTPPVRRPYTAPERLDGRAWDRRADVYSLAALVYELLFGRRVAEAGELDPATFAKISCGDPALLHRIFARALAVNPAERFASAGEFASAFQQLVTANEKQQQSAVESRLSMVDTEDPWSLDTPEPVKPPEIVPLLVSDKKTSRPEASTERPQTKASRPDVSSSRPETKAQRPETKATRQPLVTPEIRPAEPLRFHEVDSVSAIFRTDERSFAPPMPELQFAADQSRSAFWPLGLTLVVGLAVGFASGYLIGNRDYTMTLASRVSSPIGQTPAASQAPAETVANETPRETTESTVSEPSPAAASSPNGASSLAASSPSASSSAAASPAASEPAASSPAAAQASPPAAVTIAPQRLSGAKRAAESNPGRLLVRTEPGGARVFVDGRDYGLTPAVVEDLPLGPHKMRIVREGFQAEDRSVFIARSHLEQAITISLSEMETSVPTPQATSGALMGELSIDSRPVGARVFLDDRLVGATPLVLSQVPVGQHVIRLDQPGYRRWSSPVHVTAGERNRVTASLER